MIATAADIVRKAIENCKRATTIKTEDLPDIIIEKPKRDEFGDFATNVAMLLAGKEGKPPRQIAEAIAKEIRQIENIKKVEVAGHGFINIFMDDEYWLSLLKEVHNLKEKYGTSDAGSGKKVQVEFVSANPTGPLHIGHGRGAAVGDSLANILKAAGYKVVKEYYVNDAGRQVYILGESVRKRMEELQGKDVEFSDDYYKGEYVKEIAKDFLAERSSAGKAQSTSTVQDFACEAMLERIKKDLQDFGVEFDNWFSEKTLEDEGLVNNAIEELRKNGYIYEDEGAVWFRTTQLGDDKDRVLIKADNEKTYFASDIAYHKKKAESGFSTIVNIWGADHHGYEARVRAALKAFGYDDNILKIIFIQLVALLRNGVQVPMGKREGEFVTLRQVIDEVGKDACRFFFLMRKSDAQLEFDLELAKKQAPENPVFYVQYAHARICSIIKHAKENGISLPTTEGVDIKLLSLKEELDIIKKLASFPDIVKGSAIAMEPHRITFYLQELAGLFHPYYNKNRVVADDKSLTNARLYLCEAVKRVMQNGLKFLGVSAPEEM
ncbi:MAG: arginine--tRNA ligase [Deltaproteobacteria bacterium RIFCSPLOWO2_12_FULL_43_16]|nr:MAG: arginine--tRNA ligase [Deltaproteobacteria bacterium RIFCSPHIGHO2_02_FULL_43_33]OGQ38287.1 MAG: arginine--tRNA ligase [Deltaproteobacteria bacterium RIFCSPLOWO2_01_FULL_42_9]OGQ61013.1 MAG: arginine--tRNA ligase [Deltaproteobacteria bacterium RIFCSPLOWO2_12_FULL_43_16]HBR16585.1 arginine--tRNA ligase [Deltaproteobacteria bacterium]